MPVSTRHPSDEYPGLRAYAFHGVDLAIRGSHAVGDCAFCGGEGKFSVAVDTGLWRCWVCGGGMGSGGGNPLTFLRLWYEQCSRTVNASTRPSGLRNGRVGTDAAPVGLRVPRLDLAKLNGTTGFATEVASDRRLLDPSTVDAWGICQAPDGAWLVPGYGTDGKLDQVYRRTKIKKRDKWVWQLLPTPGVWPEGKVHALHLAVRDFDPGRLNVVVCEGPWDGMALWEVWPRDGSTNIIAVPGCNVWRDEWTELCRDKNVTLLYDSDYPRDMAGGGKMMRAGYDGMERVTRRLAGIANSVRFVRWGPDGYDPALPDGWDVRDELTNANVNLNDRLPGLLARVEDAPAEWLLETYHANGGARTHKPVGVGPAPCDRYDVVEAALRDALEWRQCMSDVTAVLFAVCASTMQAGNQLFFHVVGDAGSAKTTLCEGLLVSDTCKEVEHLKNFFSGWKKPGDSDKDCSLLARINGKTLVTCEADVLIASPHYQQLMSQGRRIFDGKSTATHGNSDEDRVYSGLRTPWIMAGTPALLDVDHSRLGDRYLRIVMDAPDEDTKRAISRRAFRSEMSSVREESNGTAASIVDAKLRRAHALMGGYVDYLRANASTLIAGVDMPAESEDSCLDLADLTADLRARPNEDKRKLETHDTKELPTRIARQLGRLAMCLAVVLNKTTVDADVLRIVRKVAMDTAKGHTLKLVQWLCSPHHGGSGMSYQESGGLMNGILGQWTGMNQDRLNRYLTFLRTINVLEMRSCKGGGDAWVLTDRVYDLYLKIMRNQ